MPDEELEARVTAVERRVDRAETKLSKIDAHERSIQALHLDNRDLRREMVAGFGKTDAGFDEMRQQFAFTNAAIVLLAERMDVTEVDLQSFKIEVREFQGEVREFQSETRSNFAEVHSRLDHLQTGLTEVLARLDRLPPAV